MTALRVAASVGSAVVRWRADLRAVWEAAFFRVFLVAVFGVAMNKNTSREFRYRTSVCDFGLRTPKTQKSRNFLLFCTPVETETDSSSSSKFRGGADGEPLWLADLSIPRLGLFAGYSYGCDPFFVCVGVIAELWPSVTGK